MDYTAYLLYILKELHYWWIITHGPWVYDSYKMPLTSLLESKKNARKQECEKMKNQESNSVSMLRRKPAHEGF